MQCYIISMKMEVVCSSYMRQHFYSVTRRNKPEDVNLILQTSEIQIRKNKELFKHSVLKRILNKFVPSGHKRSDNTRTYVSSRISSLDTDRNLGNRSHDVEIADRPS
jgi:hypothetical protein